MWKAWPEGENAEIERTVSLGDRFRFECKRCACCCYKYEFRLTPYDILRLCHGLNITTGAFLARYGRIAPDPEGGLPVFWLDFAKVQRTMGDEGVFSCPFLDLNEDQFLCRVYPFRPTRCRSYPLLKVDADRDQETFYLWEVTCRAKETTKAYTVAEWIEYEGLAPYFRENRRFQGQVRALLRAGEEWPEEFLQLLSELWYNFSSVREVDTLREKYERAMRGSALLTDAMIKIYRGGRKGNEGGGGRAGGDGGGTGESG